jgi:S-DNA-T family DNA segregation ATPase FtsK/SpoIIIE
VRFGVKLRQALPVLFTWPLVAQSLGFDGAGFAGVTRTPLGVKVTLHLRPPVSASFIATGHERIAAAYGASRVRVEADSNASDVVWLFIDYALALGSVLYPWDGSLFDSPLDPLRPLPLGLDDSGDAVFIKPLGQGVLLGGIPGSGKSNLCRTILSGLAPSQNVALWGLDPKRAELVLWRSRFSRLVLGHDEVETADLLEDLLAIVHQRALFLATTGGATLLPSARHPAIVLLVDEWAEVAATGSTKDRQRIDGLLRRVVSLGRAVGVTAVLATQRPTSDTIDVTTRSLLAHRFALRVGDRYQADAILGVGSYDPSQLIGASPGRALWSDGGPAKAVQVYLVPDELVPSIVASSWTPASQE